MQVDIDDYLDSAETGDGEKQIGDFCLHLSPDSLCNALELLQVIILEEGMNLKKNPNPINSIFEDDKYEWDNIKTFLRRSVDQH